MVFCVCFEGTEGHSIIVYLSPHVAEHHLVLPILCWTVSMQMSQTILEMQLFVDVLVYNTGRLSRSSINTEFNDTRKIICLRKT